MIILKIVVALAVLSFALDIPKDLLISPILIKDYNYSILMQISSVIYKFS